MRFSWSKADSGRFFVWAVGKAHRRRAEPPWLYEHVAAAERAGRGSYDDRDEAKTGLRHRVRFVSAVPLKEANADLRVNVLEGWEWDQAQGQHVSWVTDLRVHQGTVSQRMRGGRARWRIAHETCNTLNNHGDPFAHNFGHGYQHLSVVFALRLLLAFRVTMSNGRRRHQGSWWANCAWTARGGGVQPGF